MAVNIGTRQEMVNAARKSIVIVAYRVAFMLAHFLSSSLA